MVEKPGSQCNTDLQLSICDTPIVRVGVVGVLAEDPKTLFWLFQHPLGVHKIPQHLQVGMGHLLDNGPDRRRSIPIVMGLKHNSTTP